MQPNLINEEPKKRNYDFIDHIRCLAMMSIVFEHSFGEYIYEHNTAKYWTYVFVILFGKFGTVIFFLLAGFLIGDKFTDYTPGQYLKRRFANTFGPWLFWSLFYILCTGISLRITGKMYHDDRFNLAHMLDEVRITFLYTNYWFIINFMVSIMLLLVFKRYLYSWIFGGVLLSFTLIYCLNIHTQWFDPSHTTAILGFIFFLWLGAQMRKHWPAVEHWVKGLSYLILIAGVVITFGFSFYEGYVLMHTKSIDPYNTLRLSNVLFSLSVFALLLKIKNFPLLNYLKPRQTTYGIYLIHYVIIGFALNEILRPFDVHQQNLTAMGYLLYHLGSFILVYAITIIVVMLLNKTPARKLVGN